MQEYHKSAKKTSVPDSMMDIEDNNIEDTKTGISLNSSGKKLGRFSSNNLQNMGLNTNTTTKQQQSNNTSNSNTNYNEEYEDKEVNYYTITAKSSIFPLRQCFCSVCGYIGNYSCTRCGSKFCSIKCNENHKETRCFKFSM